MEKTLIETAKRSYRKMRKIGWNNLSQEDRQWFLTFRRLKNYTKYWRKSTKQSIITQASNSLEEAKNWLARWEPFEEWFNEMVSTDSAPAGLTYAPSQRRLDSLKAEVTSKLNEVREQIDLLEDVDTPEETLEAVKDEYIVAAQEAGLETVDEKNERDDGALWFVDPETDTEYYLILGNNHPRYSPYKIIQRFKFYDSKRWKPYPNVDLWQLAMGYTSHYPSMRTIGARYGARGLKDLERFFVTPPPFEVPWAHRFN